MIDEQTYSRPRGTADLDARAARRHRAVETAVLAACRRRGYREIGVPAIEYEDLYDRDRIGEELFHKLIVGRVSEAAVFPSAAGGTRRHKTHAVVLRPELTAPLARWYVEGLLFGEIGRTPQRVAHAGPVFRNVRPARHRSREAHHVGAELFGCADPAADDEILDLGREAMDALGLKDCTFHIGHAELYRRLLEESVGVAATDVAAVWSDVESLSRIAQHAAGDDEAAFAVFLEVELPGIRDKLARWGVGCPDREERTIAEWRQSLGETLAAGLTAIWRDRGLDSGKRGWLMDFARIGGAPEEALPRLEERCVTGEARRAAAELARTCARLEEQGVRVVVTPAASRSLRYYDGLTFEIHVRREGRPTTIVCGGGRYDDLPRCMHDRIRATLAVRGHDASRTDVPPGALSGVGLAFDVGALTELAAAGDAAEPLVDVLVTFDDDGLAGDAAALAAELRRRRELDTECQLPGGAGLEAQLARAGEARHVLVLERETWTGDRRIHWRHGAPHGARTCTLDELLDGLTEGDASA